MDGTSDKQGWNLSLEMGENSILSVNIPPSKSVEWEKKTYSEKIKEKDLSCAQAVI